MKPILFEKDATTFDTLGICRLPDAISCTVTEARNGEFELEMVYPRTGVGFEELANDRIIVAKAREQGTKQAFRIYRIETLLTGEVTVSARHISYALNFCPVPTLTGNGTAQDMMTALKAAAETPCPFTFESDLTTARAFAISIPSPLRTALGGMQGSVLDTYGGEFVWDNWTVKLLAARGSDKGARIAYGKNLTALDHAVDIGDLVTGIMAYYKGTDESGAEVVVYSTPHVIVNSAAAQYAHSRVLVLDVSGEFQSIPTSAQVTAYATSYLAGTAYAQLTEALTVDFVPLWQTEEYDLTMVEHIDLCDTVTVSYRELGIEVKKKVTKTVYNVLLDRYDSIELGGESDVADTIASMSSESEAFARLLAGKADRGAANINAVLWRSALGVSFVQSGIAQTTVSGTTATAHVDFPTPFLSAPNVVCSVQGNSTNMFEGRPYNITTTGFDIISIRNSGGTNTGVAVNVQWIAVGPSDADAQGLPYAQGVTF